VKRGKHLRVAVLMGGPSREREVSLASGAAVAEALSKRGHDVLPVRIAKDGRWELPSPSAPTALPGAAGEETSGTSELAESPAAAVARLESRGAGNVDAVFIALHGAYGEDGTAQGFLETLRIPYTGSGVAASAIAMDKERTKEILAFHGLRSAPWASVERAAWDADAEAALLRVEQAVGYPSVVKPPRDGSSFGVTLVAVRDELRAAVATGLEGRDARVLVEKRIAGTEVTCPVLGNRGGELRVLPLVEIVPRGREFFDFAAKYEGKSEEICPARVPEAVAEKVRADAMTAHRVLGCDGISRSDFIVQADGTPVYLETNTVPGMTPASLCPLSARHAGMSFEDLCEALLELALRRK
jgi:D-alanine-D-alanine ligase